MILEAGGTPVSGSSEALEVDVPGFIAAVKQATTHDTYVFVREENAAGRPVRDAVSRFNFLTAAAVQLGNETHLPQGSVSQRQTFCFLCCC